MDNPLKTARFAFTIFASMLLSTVTIAAAVGPAHPLAAPYA
jgi:hypothetical protein